MPLPSIIVGPADVFVYRRNTSTIAAPVQLVSGDVTSAAEIPAIGIDGATPIAASTQYQLSPILYGAYTGGGLACTVPPTNYAFTTAAGATAIKVTLTVPAYTLAAGVLVNNQLAAIVETPLSVRQGASGTAQVVIYYLPATKAISRTDITALMTGVTVYGYDRISYAETTGDINVNFNPTAATIARNAGADISVVTAIQFSFAATLLATGKEAMADVAGGVATKVGGLKDKQTAAFGYRGLGVPAARPVELVGPSDTAGVDDSWLMLTGLKLSDQQISKNYSKTNASQVPVSFLSVDDTLVKGCLGSMLHFAN